MLMKHNQNNPKSRFPNAAMQEGYYNSAYFSKQNNPNVDYYGKYEVEFSASHQKGALANQVGAFNSQNAKGDFVEPKNAGEFSHPVKGEFVHGVKPEFGQSPHHKGIEFHHGKAQPHFHLNHQNMYGHHNSASAMHNQNVDGATHQVPMQYNANQYYPNEYGNANEMDSAYYDQKASAQANYYESMYHNSNNSGAAADFHGDAAYSTPPNGQLPEHCGENFMYQNSQYFENNSHQNSPHQAQQHLAANHHPGAVSVQSPQLQHQHHISHGHNPLHQSQPTSAAMHAFNHGIGATPFQQHLNGAAASMDNSNSSSDFNFLSNLANDFAPEYYQLS